MSKTKLQLTQNRFVCIVSLSIACGLPFNGVNAVTLSLCCCCCDNDINDNDNFRDEVEVDAAAVDQESHPPLSSSQQQQSNNVTAFTPLKGSPQEILKETIQTKRFWVSSENFCFF